jgi:predicted nucleotidyltransferase
MNPDFRDFFELLQRHGVDFAIIGGVAYNHYAPPRATKDIDIWVRPSPENVARLIDAIGEFGFPTEAIDRTELVEPAASVLMLGRVPNRIDVLTHPKGLDWTAASPRLTETSYGGLRVAVIGLDDLIVAKRAAARPQDIVDVAMLEQIARIAKR